MLKYIVVKDGPTESAILFQPLLKHSHVAAGYAGLVVGAGFYRHGQCEGGSETMGIVSRGKHDTELVGLVLELGALK